MCPNSHHTKKYVQLTTFETILDLFVLNTSIGFSSFLSDKAPLFDTVRALTKDIGATLRT